MSSSEIKALIEAIFKGVTLDGGVSQLQCEVMDNYGEGVTHREFILLPQKEVTDDWAAVPEETLLYTAYLDAKGFRYYIPAFMLSCLATDLWLSDTIFTLYPKQDTSWSHRMSQYSLLNAQQRSAIAQFLHWLPQIIELDRKDTIRTERALRNYWQQFL